MNNVKHTGCVSYLSNLRSERRKSRRKARAEFHGKLMWLTCKHDCPMYTAFCNKVRKINRRTNPRGPAYIRMINKGGILV